MQNDFIKRSDAIACVPQRGVCAGWEVRSDLSKLPAADVRSAISREQLTAVLEKYFEIGDSYTYELTRVKEAFTIGTMSLNDFVEWDSEKVADLCDYLIKNLLEADGGEG